MNKLQLCKGERDIESELLAKIQEKRMEFFPRPSKGLGAAVSPHPQRIDPFQIW
jgi:hypothetical protein